VYPVSIDIHGTFYASSEPAGPSYRPGSKFISSLLRTWPCSHGIQASRPILTFNPRTAFPSIAGGGASVPHAHDAERHVNIIQRKDETATSSTAPFGKLPKCPFFGLPSPSWGAAINICLIWNEGWAAPALVALASEPPCCCPTQSKPLYIWIYCLPFLRNPGPRHPRVPSRSPRACMLSAHRHRCRSFVTFCIMAHAPRECCHGQYVCRSCRARYLDSRCHSGPYVSSRGFCWAPIGGPFS
jgi:hypothetical protein